MGLLKQIIEGEEKFGKMKPAPDGGVVWTTNPNLRTYTEASELNNEDVAYIVATTVLYFRRALGINLSIIERFHVKKITQDTIQRFKHVFRDFPEGTSNLSNDEFTSTILRKYFLNDGPPGNMYLEVVQRMMIEVYSVPLEVHRGCAMTLKIPRCELDYLSIIQHRQQTPFIGEDYHK